MAMMSITMPVATARGIRVRSSNDTAGSSMNASTTDISSVTSTSFAKYATTKTAMVASSTFEAACVPLERSMWRAALSPINGRNCPVCSGSTPSSSESLPWGSGLTLPAILSEVIRGDAYNRLVENPEQQAAGGNKDGAHKRILALDVGTRRIGVAVSDALGITAQVLVTIQRKNK